MTACRLLSLLRICAIRILQNRTHIAYNDNIIITETKHNINNSDGDVSTKQQDEEQKQQDK